ncbi:MAG TPA: hypothetical protein VHL10_00715 [Nitrososphaera sp.]|jgi:hypothetical protein|nr:hypothetical protein [Nitrososphaera sp.]
MPRNSKEFVYIPVPVRRGSRLQQNLRNEAARATGVPANHKQIAVGPYIADLLNDRDRGIYGPEEDEEGERRDRWYSTSSRFLTSLIEQTVQKVLASLGPVQMQAHVEPVKTEVIEEAPDDALAAAWGADDDDEEE